MGVGIDEVQPLWVAAVWLPARRLRIAYPLGHVAATNDRLCAVQSVNATTLEGNDVGFGDTPTTLGKTDTQDAAKTGTSVLRALDMALDDAAVAEEVTPEVD